MSIFNTDKGNRILEKFLTSFITLKKGEILSLRNECHKS
jgi:hypothetical protein